jgi:hypothetical protein
VRQSAIFLAIVTPSSCTENSFCRKELDWFCGESRAISGSPIDIGKRIFKIESRPVPREEQTEKLRDHPSYKFYEGDPTPPGFENYRLLGVNAIDSEPKSRISIEFGRLAQALQAFLDTCKRSQSMSPIKMVFLAESTCLEQGSVRAEIRMHEIVESPISSGLTEAEFIAKTEQLLASSDCSIHLINTSEPLVVPPNWHCSAVENQILCAHRVKTANFQAIVWCDSQREIQDSHLKELMTRTRDEYVDKGPIRYYSQGIQYLMSNLPDLPAKVIQQPVKEAIYSSAPQRRRVFVQCVKDDLAKLEPAFQKLNSLGISIQTPVFDGRRSELKKHFKKFLAETDGTLIYWGSGGDAYTYTLCDQTVEMLGSDFEHKKRVVGIDPPDVVRRRFTHRYFSVVEFPADPEQLTEQQIRKAFL